MRYRGLMDRSISTYAALLIITIIGSGMTLFIVHTVATINFTYSASGL